MTDNDPLRIFMLAYLAIAVASMTIRYLGMLGSGSHRERINRAAVAKFWPTVAILTADYGLSALLWPVIVVTRRNPFAAFPDLEAQL